MAMNVTDDGNGYTRRERIGTRLAHWEPVLLALIGAAYIALQLVHLPDWPRVLGGFVLIGLLFGTWWISHWHRYRLCERCMAATPLDPERAIRRHHRALGFVHRRWWVAIAPLVAYLLGTWVGLWFGLSVLETAALVVLYANFTAAAYAMQRHFILQPWCPWCRDGWDDDGEHECTPDPIPQPSVERVA